MTGERARSGLSGTRFADVRWVAETGSTNTDLLEEARHGAPEGRVLVADHQGAGKGRLGRRWDAPPGASLLASILVRPTLGLDRVQLLTLALGVAIVEAMESISIDSGLKWPNDLVVDTSGGERKLAGVLAESLLDETSGQGTVRAVVLGFGLNVAWGGNIPEELESIAIALDLLGVRADREDLLVEILRNFERWYVGLADPANCALLLDAYRRRCVTLGRRVRVETTDGHFEGDAVEVDDSGHLLVNAADGVREVAAGDVVHVR